LGYAVQADLVPRRLTQIELVELTNDAGGNDVVAGVVTDVLTEASGVVDSYCRQRYTIPLQPSEMVKGLTLDITVYKLFQRRRRETEATKDAYTLAIKFLQDVSAGKASLDQPVGASAQSGSGNVMSTEIDEKFSDDNLTGFIT
jgi:phage gp36-like protein